MADSKVYDQLILLANEEKASVFLRFFKTGKGQYAEGDKFLGITVPQVRSIAKENFRNLDLEEISKLIENPFHEIRLCALIMLTYKFQAADKIERKEIYKLYLKNKAYVNNWDLVDSSADKVLGEYLFENSEEIRILENLATSGNLWDRRISVLATFAFIKKNQFDEAIKISEILLNDKHDLMHKAVGWMLREIGKREISRLITFLDKYYRVMPRTMLRYSIEKLTVERKKHYMSKS